MRKNFEPYRLVLSAGATYGLICGLVMVWGAVLVLSSALVPCKPMAKVIAVIFFLVTIFSVVLVTRSILGRQYNRLLDKYERDTMDDDFEESIYLSSTKEAKEKVRKELNAKVEEAVKKYAEAHKLDNRIVVLSKLYRDLYTLSTKRVTPQVFEMASRLVSMPDVGIFEEAIALYDPFKYHTSDAYKRMMDIHAEEWGDSLYKASQDYEAFKNRVREISSVQTKELKTKKSCTENREREVYRKKYEDGKDL